jgi:hypothetical protein
MHKHKKRKAFKKVVIQDLTKEDLEKIRDQVKEVTKEAFLRATQNKRRCI